MISVASFFPSSLSYSDSFEEGIEEEMYSTTVFIILQSIYCVLYI